MTRWIRTNDSLVSMDRVESIRVLPVFGGGTWDIVVRTPDDCCDEPLERLGPFQDAARASAALDEIHLWLGNGQQPTIFDARWLK